MVDGRRSPAVALREGAWSAKSRHSLVQRRMVAGAAGGGETIRAGRSSARPLILAGVLLFVFPSVARAESPAFLPLQGVLSDKKGEPIEGNVQMTFTLYDAPVKGKPLWSETQTLLTDRGLFVAYLGTSSPLDLSLFREHGNVWLAVKVEDDPEMARTFLGTVPFSAYAQYCGEVPEHTHPADQLQGVVKGGQGCNVGQVVTGFSPEGVPLCAPAGTYTGNDFALSAQTCPPNNVVSGVSPDGHVQCVLAGGSYDGGDFALSNQKCSSGKVVTGVNTSGTLVCDAAGGGIGGDGTAKKLARFYNSTTIEDSIVYDSGSKVGIATTSPSRTLEVKGDLGVSGDFYWGGNKFSSSSCLVVGGSSCSSACSAHGMSCHKAFRIDGPSTSDSCSQSGFKFCCCTN